MRHFDAADHPAHPVDPAHFTGDATMARMDGLSETPRINVYRVRFQPGARTDWHSHSGPQLLLVIEGRCRFQKKGHPPGEVGEGGAVRFDPGDRHWHGSTPDGPMTHLAVNIDATTEWFDKVSDAEYAGR